MRKFFNNSIKTLKMVSGIIRLKNADTLEERKRGSKYLYDLFGNEKGLFIKIGQLLGSSSDDYSELAPGELEKLNSISYAEVIEIIEQAYARPWQEIFQSIEEYGRTASISQVHKAVLLNGDIVAVKIKYPGINEIIQGQLKVLDLLPVVSKFGPMKKWGVPINEYKNFIQHTIADELDYQKEVEHQLEFKQNNTGLSYICTSEIYEDLVRDDVYVQSFEEGGMINEVLPYYNEVKKRNSAHCLLESFIINIFQHGLIQGDPNDGNFLYRHNAENRAEIVYLDFGNTIQLSPHFRKILFSLIQNTITGNPINILAYFSEMGFDTKKLRHIEKSLPMLVKTIFEPFVTDYNFDMSKWNINRDMDTILGEYKWWFRASGPIEFFALMKSFLVVFNHLKKFDAKLNWRKIFQRNTMNLLMETASLKVSDVGLEQQEILTFKSLATHLKIKVIENGREKVFLTLPITTILELEGIMDDEVKERLLQRKIVLKELVTACLRNGCIPGELFFLDEGAKQFKVWIE